MHLFVVNAEIFVADTCSHQVTDLMPVSLSRANEQKIGEGPEDIFASRGIRRLRPLPGLGLELSLKWNHF